MLDQIRGTLKSWTKLWCILKPGILLIYKTPGSEHWVGTILLNACKLIERPSKKDGFCFKVYHPLDKSIWAMKVRQEHLQEHVFLTLLLGLIGVYVFFQGPKGESVGSITQPLPSNYLIFRAASESDGEHWHFSSVKLPSQCEVHLKAIQLMSFAPGRCWMDALELALSCSSLSKMTAKSCRDGDLSSSSESSHILQLLQCTALTDQDLVQ